MHTLFALLTVLIPAFGPAAPDIDAPAAFRLLKTLEGRWEAPHANGVKATTTFSVVGDGTVLVEHYENPALPGGGRMVTAYHLDGSSLVLTHYCIAHNQPVLRAETFDAAAGQMQFEFVRAGNLPNADSGHMRRAMYRITSKDSFVTEWEFFKGGQKVMTEREVFARVR